MIEQQAREWSARDTNCKSYVVGYKYAKNDFDPEAPTHLLCTGQPYVNGFAVATQIGNRYLGFSICRTDLPVTPCRWTFFREPKVHFVTVEGAQVGVLMTRGPSREMTVPYGAMDFDLDTRDTRTNACVIASVCDVVLVRVLDSSLLSWTQPLSP